MTDTAKMDDVHPLMRTYDVALLDLDGVVYIGGDPVEYAPGALRAAREAGMRVGFVTNNASRPPSAVADHLNAIGIRASPDEVVSSAQAAARLLAEQLPRGSRVLLVGGEGLAAALAEHGLVPVTTFAARPAAVAQGFAPEVDWRLLAEGTYAVASGLPWVASNVDSTIPTPGGLAPGNGALVDVIRTVTGREPVVAGKPEPPMHREAIVRTGSKHPLVVGDRLDTDIEGANAAGVDSLLVLTGVTGPVDVVMAPPALRPTYLGMDLRALSASASNLSVAPGKCGAGRWTAAMDNGSLQLNCDGPTGTEPELDALRAACGAAWSASTAVDRATVSAALRASGWEPGAKEPAAWGLGRH